MMNEANKPTENVLYRDLPPDYLPEPNLTNRTDFLPKLLSKELARNDFSRSTNEMSTPFFLTAATSRKRPKKGAQRKKTFLTRKERKQLDILKLPKTGWNYESLQTMRDMWKRYMAENLDLARKSAPNCTDPDWASFALILTRSELAGAEVTVVRSKVPSQVGMHGTVVLETKQTFQIVTPESKFKILSKNSSLFEFRLGNLKVSFFGKQLIMKPSERSVKKIKSQMLPDI